MNKPHKSLQEQVAQILMDKRAFGASKREYQLSKSTNKLIFSFSTFQAYKKHCKDYCKWLKDFHPEVRYVVRARKYVAEWLDFLENTYRMRNGKPLSASTIHLKAKAVGCLFNITPDDPDYHKPPSRRRADIIRGRNEELNEAKFPLDVEANAEIAHFSYATGPRRKIMRKLDSSDLISKNEMQSRLRKLERKSLSIELSKAEVKDRNALEEALKFFSDFEYFIHHRTDKGGRDRYAPIIGDYADEVIMKMKETPENEKVWNRISPNAPIHSYRARYAETLYQMYARPLEQIKREDAEKKKKNNEHKSEVYYCRKDQKGKALDKAAMLKTSKALGHNRISVIASHYLYHL